MCVHHFFFIFHPQRVSVAKDLLFLSAINDAHGYVEGCDMLGGHGNSRKFDLSACFVFWKTHSLGIYFQQSVLTKTKTKPHTSQSSIAMHTAKGQCKAMTKCLRPRFSQSGVFVKPSDNNPSIDDALGGVYMWRFCSSKWNHSFIGIFQVCNPMTLEANAHTHKNAG